jgi:hypothetical protein
VRKKAKNRVLSASLATFLNTQEAAEAVPYGPGTWGPTQWLSVLGYLLAFGLAIYLVYRLAAPSRESESEE